MHAIPSAYGKDDILKLIGETYKANGIIYVENKSSSPASWLLSPISNLRSNNNILQKSDIVNKYFEKERLEQAAYHGTPHIFDIFSTENIGTGEGNQAHGWGLYFAADKGVSERYRKFLSNGNDVDFVSSKPISQEQKEYLKDLIDWNNIDNSNKDWYLKRLKNEIKYMQDMFTKTFNNAEQDKQTQTYLLNKLNEFDGEIEQFINALTNEELSMKVDFYGKLISVKDFFKQIIGAYPTKQDIIQRFNKKIDSDNMRIEKAKEILNSLKDIDLDSLNVQIKKAGQLFKVDIPEENELLDEQKTFDEQPKKVQEALNKLIKNNMYRIEKSQLKEHEGEYELIKGNEVIDIYDDIEEVNRALKENNDTVENSLGKIKQANGRQIYNIISDYLGTFKSDRDTSLLLNEYGIKGITYDGRQDGRCYVIFDDKAVKVLETYYQDNLFVDTKKATNKIVRGFITGDEIHVTGASDISTYIHEMGHYWLRDLQNYVLSGQATEEVLKEWNTIKAWLNITDETISIKKPALTLTLLLKCLTTFRVIPAHIV